MTRAPVFIEVALWYYTRCVDHPSVVDGASSYSEAVAQMVGLGMLIAINTRNRSYEATEAMKVYVEALCAIPTPIQRWVIPDES